MSNIAHLHPDQDKMAEFAIEKIQKVVWEDLGDRGISRAAIVGALEVVKQEVLNEILLVDSE